MKKILIVYYSWSNGNTERIARALQEETAADIVKLDTAEPYQGSYDRVVSQGQHETEIGFEPQLKPYAVDWEEYDVIAVGTPTWWYTMAPAVKTFLHREKWQGKLVVPFATNGGWPGHVIRDIESLCAGAEFTSALQVKFDSTGGAQMETASSEIKAWAHEVGNLLQP
jgi:flavodoxin